MTYRTRIQVRRTLKTFALASLLGLATMGLSQCRLVGDTVTGVELESNGVNGRSECVQRCNDEYKAADKAEATRHAAALRACGTSRSCKDSENLTHKGNKAAIVDAMQECKRACYNEGSGNGGR